MARQQVNYKRVYDHASTKQWIAARASLVAMNLPIDENGCMLAGHIFDLMQNPQFVRDLEIYLAPSPYEIQLSETFSRVSNLIDMIFDHPDVWQRLIERVCQLSDDAIYCLRNKNMGRLLYLEIVLTNHLQDLTAE